VVDAYRTNFDKKVESDIAKESRKQEERKRKEQEKLDELERQKDLVKSYGESKVNNSKKPRFKKNIYVDDEAEEDPSNLTRDDLPNPLDVSISSTESDAILDKFDADFRAAKDQLKVLDVNTKNKITN